MELRERVLGDTIYIADVPYMIGSSTSRTFLLHPNVKKVTSLFPSGTDCTQIFRFGSLKEFEDRLIYLNGQEQGKLPLLVIWYMYQSSERIFFGGLGHMEKKLSKGIRLGWWPSAGTDLGVELLATIPEVKRVYDHLELPSPRNPSPWKFQKNLSPDFLRMRWDQKLASQSKNIHWGQLKLHISEVEYLLAKGALEQRTMVIYPGGGPGLHIPLLASLFPLVKFVLIDPVFSEPEIPPHPQIYWIASLFDITSFEKMVSKAKKADPDLQILLFSDIRSSPGPEPEPVKSSDSESVRRSKLEEKRKYEKEFEEEVQKNMTMQLEWQRRLKVPALLKFRLRFNPGQTKYPKGHLAFQVFSRPTSAELRLWSEDPDDLTSYDHTTIEEQMFHFNHNYRPKSFYATEPDLGANYDSTKTGVIFREYIRRASLVEKVGKDVPVYGPERSPKKIEDTLVVMLAIIHDRFFKRNFLVDIINGKTPLPKKLLKESAEDLYPYKRTFTPDQEYRDRFRRLKGYSLEWAPRPSDYRIPNLGTTVSPFKMLYRGEPTLVKVHPTNYHDFDNFDFQEKERVRCKRYDQEISSYQYWLINQEQIVKETQVPSEQRELLYQRHYECTSFKPTLIKGFIDHFKAKRVLDISAGWGDRLIGAIAAGVEYFGSDPNQKLQPGYREIIDFFGADPRKYQVKASTFETVILPKEPFDMVLTSPPYFNLEEYGDVPVPKSLTAWLKDFLYFSLSKASSALKEGGHMLININDSKDVHYVGKMLEFNLKNMIYLGCISQAELSARIPKSPQPFWIWKKVSLPEIDQLNPPVEISTYTFAKVKFRVVRDDLLLGGTKQRIVKDLFQAHPEGIIYPGPETGYAQIALALGAKLSGSRVKILTREVRPPTKQTVLASQLGAEIIEYRGNQGNLKALKEHAEKIAKTEGMYLPKLGFEGEHFKESMIKALDESLDLDRKFPHKFWIVAGSGTLALTLHDMFPRATFNVVQVGKEVDWLFKDLPRVNFFKAPENFWDPAKDPPPYPSLSTYDAKLWQFAKNDLEGSIIWNVAGPVREF